MMLGAGSNQLNAIKRIQEMGYEILVSDYYEDSPGKKLAKNNCLASTFSFEETYEQATKHAISGIMTSGTDQPILTVAKVAKSLKLTMLITEQTALEVTNKRHMKKRFLDFNIPTANYIEFSEQTTDEELDKIKFPAVLKPVDTQGQRGIFFVKDKGEARKKLKKSLSFSREEVALLEEYYENKEVTVTGWVENGEVYIITITDRVTFKEKDKLGVCVSHEFPTVHFDGYNEEFIDITKRVVDAFGIKRGPIYFQYLVGDLGVIVNEIACRIGGAYEDQFIPKICGVDLLKMNVRAIMGDDISDELKALKKYNYLENKNYLSVQLFFAKEGKISKMTSRDKLLSIPYVFDFGVNFKEGDTIEKIENATQRAGFFIVLGNSEEEIRNNIQYVYDKLEIQNVEGENLIIKGKRGNRDV
jgi:biotin carboxylase